MRWLTAAGLVVAGALAAIAILVGLGVPGGSTGGPSPTPLPPVPVAAEVVAEGRAVPATAAELGTAVAGTVAEVAVAEGETVAAGATLLRLDSAAADAEVDAAEATLEAATARVAQAQAAADQAAAGVDRARATLQGARASRDLLPDDASSARERAANAQVDAAEAGLAAARAAERGAGSAVEAAEGDRRRAEAALEGARTARSRLTMTAPFAGTVVSVLPEVGDVVGPGPTLVRLAVPGRWVFEAREVDEAAVASFAVGAPATVTLDALPGVEIPGRVATISGYGEEVQGDIVFTVVVEPDGAAPDGVRWNMTATISISTGE